jgi:hypothetical protein
LPLHHSAEIEDMLTMAPPPNRRMISIAHVSHELCRTDPSAACRSNPLVPRSLDAVRRRCSPAPKGRRTSIRRTPSTAGPAPVSHIRARERRSPAAAERRTVS